MRLGKCERGLVKSAKLKPPAGFWADGAAGVEVCTVCVVCGESAGVCATPEVAIRQTSARAVTPRTESFKRGKCIRLSPEMSAVFLKGCNQLMVTKVVRK